MVKLMLIFVREFLVEFGGYEDFWKIMEIDLEMVMAVSYLVLKFLFDSCDFWP